MLVGLAWPRPFPPANAAVGKTIVAAIMTARTTERDGLMPLLSARLRGRCILRPGDQAFPVAPKIRDLDRFFLEVDFVPVDLRLTSAGGYRPGRGYVVRVLWLVVEALVFLNPVVPVVAPKRTILRWFGASIGKRVLIKPSIHIKYPWRLVVGEDAWLGERAWIDNMENVAIGEHAVISQGAYLCTGNHDWNDPGLPLSPQPIIIEPGAWVGAFATVGPGVTIRRESVLTLGTVCIRDTEPGKIYRGNPAIAVGERRVRDAPAPS